MTKVAGMGKKGFLKIFDSNFLVIILLIFNFTIFFVFAMKSFIYSVKNIDFWSIQTKTIEGQDLRFLEF